MNSANPSRNLTRIFPHVAVLAALFGVLVFAAPKEVSATSVSPPAVVDITYSGTRTVTLWFETPAGANRMRFVIAGACNADSTYEFTTLTSPQTFDLVGTGCDLPTKAAAFANHQGFTVRLSASGDNGSTWSLIDGHQFGSGQTWNPRGARAPRIVSVTPRHQGCRVAYTIERDLNASAITSYTSTRPGFGFSSTTQYRGAEQLTSPIDLVVSSGHVDDLRRLRANSANGVVGLTSKTFECNATTATSPAIPTLSVVPGDRQLIVNWSTTDDGGVWPYRVESSINGTTFSPLCGGTAVCAQQNTFTVTGLTNGTNYPVSIRVFNTFTSTQTPNYVQSSAVTASPCVCTIAGAPTIDSLIPSAGKLDVIFTAPSNNGGRPVTNYEYSTDGGSTWVTRSPASTTSPLEITGLTNGQSYSVRLRAITQMGSGTASSSSMGIANVAPTVTSISPTSGDVAGLQNVTITGTGFAAGATVRIGTSACTGVSVVSSTSITCQTSAQSAASGLTVRVTNSDSQFGELVSGYSYTTTTTTTTTTTVAPAPVVVAAPSTSPTTAPVASVVVNSTGSRLVNSSNQAALTATPGKASVLVNGVPVVPQIVTASNSAAAQADPAERSPEQVRELQRAAASMETRLDTIAGGDSGVSVVRTETGAVMTGIFSGTRVPVEDVVVVNAANTATLFAARDVRGNIVEVKPGAVLEVASNGDVAVQAFGLRAGETVELVVMSTPTLLGSFTVDAKGTIKTTAKLPTSIGSGNHSLVVASPSVKASLGLKLVKSSASLPVTGANTSDASNWAVAVMLSGMYLVLVGRRRRRLM